MNFLLVFLGKLLSLFAKTFNIGHGSTWPGHVALKINKNFISDLLNSNILGKVKKDFAIFEVDENALSHFLKIIEPDYLVLLNLFRDQLDRYGEVNIIAAKWHEAIDKLQKTTIVIN